MTAKEVKLLIFQGIKPFYDEIEAKLIARYYLEDKGFLDPQYEFTAKEVSQIQTDIIRLRKSEPLQYVTGVAHFYGHQFMVNKDVLIPRPETEELVYATVKLLKTNDSIKSVLDIGTGSGCIINTLALEVDTVETFNGLDVSKEALAVANSNALKLQSKVTFIHQDFLDESSWHKLPKVGLIVSNPPYISSGEAEEMKANVLNYEPHVALFSHEDPLLFYKTIAKYASVNNPHAVIICEINEYLSQQTVEVFKEYGYENISLIEDLQGKNRIIKVIPNGF